MTFVQDACKAWSLPLPCGSASALAGDGKVKESDSGKYPGCSITDLEMPRALVRDNLWNKHVGKTQLEFVVDSKTLADIANIYVPIDNAFYRPPLERIRRSLRFAYSSCFAYKGHFLDPVDWRAREFNTAADLVADVVMANREAIDTIEVDRVQHLMNKQGALQIFTDGGYKDGVGSAAMLLIHISWDGGELQRQIIGVRGLFLQPAHSSFHAEISALEMAADFCCTLATPRETPFR